MNDIETNWVEAKHTDGNKLNVYCAIPKGKIKGGIVVIQEIFGVNSHIRQVCEKFAKSGYLAVAPSIFDRIQPNVELGYSEQDMQVGFGLMKQLSWENVLKDVECAYSLIQEKAKVKVAVIGYCYGGTVAWRACTKLKKFAAAVAYYGGQINDYANEKPNCPVMLHFGKKDHYIPAEHRANIKSLRPELVTYEYDADHGFNCDQRASYDEASTKLSYNRTLKFLEKWL